MYITSYNHLNCSLFPLGYFSKFNPLSFALVFQCTYYGFFSPTCRWLPNLNLCTLSPIEYLNLGVFRHLSLPF